MKKFGKKKVVIGCASTFGISIFVLLAAIGLAINLGWLPDTAALPASKINPRHISKLAQMGIIKSGEKVYYFYSAGMFSISEDGNLFTDDRVISYQKFEGQFDVYEATYDEIASIDLDTSGSWLDDSIINITLKDGSWFMLLVSKEADGDKEFHKRLTDLWEIRKMQAQE